MPLFLCLSYLVVITLICYSAIYIASWFGVRVGLEDKLFYLVFHPP